MSRKQLKKRFPVLVTCREDLVDFCNLWDDYKSVCYNGKPFYIFADNAAIYTSNNSIIGIGTPDEYMREFVRLRIDWSNAKDDWNWEICAKKRDEGKKLIKSMMYDLISKCCNSNEVV